MNKDKSAGNSMGLFYGQLKYYDHNHKDILIL